MKVSRISGVVLAISSIACLASDANEQIALLKYLANTVRQMQSPTMKAKAATIFQDQMLIDMIAKRIKETKKWLAQQGTNKTLANSANRIQEAADRISRMLTLFRDKLEMIKTDEKTREIYRKLVKNFSQDRDVLNNEIGTIDRARGAFLKNKEKFADVANVLKAYAHTFSTIAQQAMADFARVDDAFFAEEQKTATKTGKPLSTVIPQLGAGHSTATSEDGEWADWDFDSSEIE